jgi:dienelactone hydrolase
LPNSNPNGALAGNASAPRTKTGLLRETQGQAGGVAKIGAESCWRQHEIYCYDAAHAFDNERSAAYDVACANQAWERMSAFLRTQIA